ncbi:unnamed protein product [Closterium sp. Yama58-4]|nr:unnamed protein product [Closterium sp. Yama58-4]
MAGPGTQCIHFLNTTDKTRRAANKACHKCPPGEVAVKALTMDHFELHRGKLPDGFVTGCSGDCGSLGWRVVNGKLDSGSNHGKSASVWLSYDVSMAVDGHVTFAYDVDIPRGDQQRGLFFYVDDQLVLNIEDDPGADSAAPAGPTTSDTWPLPAGNHSLMWIWVTLNADKAIARRDSAEILDITVWGSTVGGAPACVPIPPGTAPDPKTLTWKAWGTEGGDKKVGSTEGGQGTEGGGGGEGKEEKQGKGRAMECTDAEGKPIATMACRVNPQVMLDEQHRGSHSLGDRSPSSVLPFSPPPFSPPPFSPPLFSPPPSPLLPSPLPVPGIGHPSVWTEEGRRAAFNASLPFPVPSHHYSRATHSPDSLPPSLPPSLPGIGHPSPWTEEGRRAAFNTSLPFPAWTKRGGDLLPVTQGGDEVVPGCAYELAWYSAYACPLCSEEDVEEVPVADCHNNKRATYKYRHPRVCQPNAQAPLPPDQLCSPCTADDYSSFQQSCTDSAGNHNVSYSWNLPKNCSENLPGAVKLPENVIVGECLFEVRYIPAKYLAPKYIIITAAGATVIVMLAVMSVVTWLHSRKVYSMYSQLVAEEVQLEAELAAMAEEADQEREDMLFNRDHSYPS